MSRRVSLLWFLNEEQSINSYSGIYVTEHALGRMARRGITPDDLLYTLRFGKKEHRTGAVFFILRRRDIPVQDRRNERIAKRDGTVVLLEEDAIVTVYRKRSAHHDVRKKLKYRREE